MNVWLIAVGEPLPIDRGVQRLHRMGIIARLLIGRGHVVTWWTGVFAHHEKRTRSEWQATVGVSQGYNIELLAGREYRSNISLSRILNHIEQAADFRRRAGKTDPPDIILAAYPTIELCDAAVKYGRSHAIPVVVDVRDLWPDIFLELAPAWARPLARLPLGGMFAASRRVCSGATALTGITEPFVDWGAERAGRLRRSTDRAFPVGYEATAPAEVELERAARRWDEMGIRVGDATICFFGALGQWFDIPTVVAAGRLLAADGVRFVLCGDGDRLNDYRRSADGAPNVIFPGWVDAASIRALMGRSLAGLAPYYCKENFILNLPNKFIEYLSGELPVLSCLKGQAAALLEREDCGQTYPEGDAQALAKLIRNLIADPSVRARMAANAGRCYRERFVAEAVYGQMIDYLDQIARRKKSGAS